MRHLSWRLRLTALLPLAAGIAPHSLQYTYTYWVTFLCKLPRSFPPAFQNYFLNGIANANHTATVIGWTAIVVMGFLLALSLLQREGLSPATLAASLSPAPPYRGLG